MIITTNNVSRSARDVFGGPSSSMISVLGIRTILFLASQKQHNNDNMWWSSHFRFCLRNNNNHRIILRSISRNGAWENLSLSYTMASVGPTVGHTIFGVVHRSIEPGDCIFAWDRVVYQWWRRLGVVQTYTIYNVPLRFGRIDNIHFILVQ